MIAAVISPNAIPTYMGHSSITIMFDLDGHLMPGSEDEAAKLMPVPWVRRGALSDRTASGLLRA